MRRGLLAAGIAVAAAAGAAHGCERQSAVGTHAAAPARLSQGLPERQQRIFEQACAHCHVRPGLGIPQLGDNEEWRRRARDGREALLRRTILGSGSMPPLGTCGFCSEDDLRLLVGFLAGLAGDAGAP